MGVQPAGLFAPHHFIVESCHEATPASVQQCRKDAQTGDYRGAISDYSKVIAEYPNFMAGYYQRAEARKKIGDHKGAEQDEFKIMKMQIDKRNGVSSGDKKEGDDSKDVADNSSENSNGDGGKTRKKSDKNMENYRKIVIADDSEADQRYKSDYRGRVQDRNVTIMIHLRRLVLSIRVFR